VERKGHLPLASHRIGQSVGGSKHLIERISVDGERGILPREQIVAILLPLRTAAIQYAQSATGHRSGAVEYWRVIQLVYPAIEVAIRLPVRYRALWHT
jgi:hypothetical protein